MVEWERSKQSGACPTRGQVTRPPEAASPPNAVRLPTLSRTGSVVGALKVARENGWVVRKGRGWWQAVAGGGREGGAQIGGTGGGAASECGGVEAR